MPWPSRKPNTTARGYGTTHQWLRRQWAPLVAAGTVNCWRCGERIPPGAPWHLGHDDHDRRITRGPEHKHCNLSAAGRKARALRTDPDPQPRTRW
jgi:hypothetical protein